MRLLSNHKGISLLELLLAIFLTSITLGLIAQILTLMIRSSQSSILQSRANTTGVLIVETLENNMRGFSPTTLTFCEGETNCVILEQHFNYSLTDAGVIINYFEAPLTLKIEIIENEIWITKHNQSPYTLDLSGFTLSNDASIKVFGVTTVPLNGQKASVIIEIELVAESVTDRVFKFTAAYLFTIDLRVAP